MTQAGYISEGRALRRHRATFGFLICVSIFFLAVVATGFGLLGWYMVNHRDIAVYITIFNSPVQNVSATKDASSIQYYNIDKDTVDVHIPVDHEIQNDHHHPGATGDNPDIPAKPRGDMTSSKPTAPGWQSRTTTTPLPQADVTEEEMSRVAQTMWDADVNRLRLDLEFTLELQYLIAGNTSQYDQSDRKLFKSVTPDVRRLSRTHRRFIRLLDNYDPVVGHEELPNDDDNLEIDSFLDTLVETDIMKAVEDFLTENEVLEPSQTFRDVLFKTWFQPYPRSYESSIPDSSGFEHVFVGEVLPTRVIGLHNWIQFYMLEKKGDINYWGYHYSLELPIISVEFTWQGKRKDNSSFFLGTSPEFELGIYTLCFLTRPNSACRLAINNHQFTIRTEDVVHVPGLQIGYAYPSQ